MPVRIEVGPRDFANKQMRLVRRDNGEKSDIAFTDAASVVAALLETIQDALLAAARRGRDEKMVTVTKWEDFVPALEKQCLVMTPFCDDREWEEKVKVRIYYPPHYFFVDNCIFFVCECFKRFLTLLNHVFCDSPFTGYVPRGGSQGPAGVCHSGDQCGGQDSVQAFRPASSARGHQVLRLRPSRHHLGALGPLLLNIHLFTTLNCCVKEWRDRVWYD